MTLPPDLVADALARTHGANGRALPEECPEGHVYSDENTYVDPRGHRRCRRCNRETARKRMRRWRARQKKSARADQVARIRAGG